MLAMDIADSLRRVPGLAAGADSAARLRALYEEFGISLSDRAIGDGLAAFADDRFAYAPPSRGIGLVLARIYVARRHWERQALALVLTLAIGLGGYFLVYRPYRDVQAQQARAELAEIMPAQMDALYQTIFEETKVQQGANEANELRARGKEAAARGDRVGAEAAIRGLTNLRDTLQQEYRLTVVDRAGAKWGFWTFPQDNAEATNYYLVVEAIDASGKVLRLPIRDEFTGRTEMVASFGVRVPEQVYRSVEADKADNSTIQRDLVAVKQFGFLEPDYVVGVLGGTVTQW
jgi:hypothetical protein